MTSYRISISADSNAGEFFVRLHDDMRGIEAEACALSARHARRVARDMMDLMRAREPDSAFVVEFSTAHAAVERGGGPRPSA